MKQIKHYASGRGRRNILILGTKTSLEKISVTARKFLKEIFRNYLEIFALKMTARKVLLRYTAFLNQIPIESLNICNSDAKHLW